jgi:hypothetical protein
MFRTTHAAMIVTNHWHRNVPTAVLRCDGCACFQVKANGLLVFVPKYGIEGPVYFTGKASGIGGGGGNTAGAHGTAGACDDGDAAYILDEAKQTVSARYLTRLCACLWICGRLQSWVREHENKRHALCQDVGYFVQA